MFEQTVSIDRIEHIVNLFGNFDENIKEIEKEFEVRISSHSDEIKIKGETENVLMAKRAINGLLKLLDKGEAITDQNLNYVFSLVRENSEEKIELLTDSDCVCITAGGRPIKPKTLGQRKYLEAILSNTITIGVGPAGTGKTYLAVAMAVKAFRAKQVSRIILTRPAVEAGEKLGFLRAIYNKRLTPI